PLAAETPGKLMELHVEEGDSLRQGQLIAVVDTSALVLQRSQLESQMAALESSRPDISKQIAALRSQIAQQQHECRRVHNMLAAGAATQKQADDADAALNILNGQLDGLLSSLTNNTSSITQNARATYYQIAQINDRIAKSRTTAPITGVVLTKYAERYEYVNAGTPLVAVADMDHVYLRAYFTSDQVANLKIGQTVTVTADFGGDQHFDYPGTITWIAQESEFTPKSIQTNDSRADLVYAVKISVVNDGRLKLGLYGGVRL
ncbi:MAG: HlyD family secretion protein, partial [Muribaculaceae bacterium]